MIKPMSSSFAQADASQSAILKFCLAKRAMQDVTQCTKEERDVLKLSKKEAFTKVEEVLKCSGEGACVEVLVGERAVYAHLATRKGTVRKLTPKNAVEAIRGLSISAHDSNASPSSIVRSLLASLVQPEKQSLVLTKTRPLKPCMLPHSEVHERVSTVGSASARMKAISDDLKKTCKNYKEVCTSVEQNVVEHLRKCNPSTMEQNVRLDTNGVQTAYKLKATPKKPSVKAKDAFNICESVISQVSFECPHGMHLVEHLQSTPILTHIFQELTRRFKPMEAEFKVSLTPV